MSKLEDGRRTSTEHKLNMENVLRKLEFIPEFAEFTFYGSGLILQLPTSNTIIIDGANIGSSTTIDISGLPMGIHSIKLEKK